ncbi:MAG: RAMP superfamily CRISPR-associated protein [Sulfurisoma sp.]|nr:RAMP superfamily CRISPR-associated protein [Sulfurisoma sp.]
MSHVAIRRIGITTLSPVHVGCDEVFEPTGFVIADGLLHLLDPAVLAGALDDREKAQLIKLAFEPDPIGPIQQFFKARRDRLAPLAAQTFDVAADIAREYEDKAGQPQARGGDGRPVYNLFPMARTAFNPLDGAPYLPGSSLKGSIRTAWLSRLNRGQPPQEDEKRNPAKLQQRLLGYAPGKFENDPFRHLHVADAHADPERTAPPTRIAYAVSKKKRISERGSPELKVYLETVRETLADAFRGELRFTGGRIDWAGLCDACNAFYRPQLDAELDHPQFAPLLATDWRQLISGLLGDELNDLMAAHQGFLLRVGRHSGAESVTLDGVRSIKILGAKGEPPSYRANTTEKRFASATRAAQNGLLPFGWIWVDGSDDAHRHIAIAVADKLARLGQPIRAAQAERQATAEARREAQEAAAAEAAHRQAEAAAAAQAEADARAARSAELAAMTPNRRRIEEFRAFCEARAAQLGDNKETLNGDIHNRARSLAADALQTPDWSAEEKTGLADLLAGWLPKLVSKMDKDQMKKLKLAALRTP